MKKILFFDTETTGLPKNWSAPVTDTDNWPRLVQLGWILADTEANTIREGNMIVKPSGFEIPEQASNVHGITTEIALEKGDPLNHVMQMFMLDMASADAIVGHNVGFDLKVVGAEFCRLNFIPALQRMEETQYIDTMKSSTEYCGITGSYGRVKWPKLTELYTHLFGHAFENAHDAMADITATKECYFELVKRGVIPTLNI